MIERVNLRNSYKYYKSTESNPVDIKLYLEIVLLFIKFVMEKVFEGYLVRLFGKLGYIGIIGRKIVPTLNSNGKIMGVPPNWGKTKKHWESEATKKGITFQEYLATVPKEDRQIVYCFNEHTNGVKYNISWRKQGVLIRNKDYYNLRFSRSNKRTVSNLVNEGKEYIIYDPKK